MLATSMALAAQQSEVAEVIIRSGASYLSGGENSTVTLTLGKNGIERKSEIKRQRVSELQSGAAQTDLLDGAAVSDQELSTLLEILRHPTVTAPDFSVLRIDTAKLGEDLRTALRDPERTWQLGFYRPPCPAEADWISERMAESIQDGRFARDLEAYFVTKVGPDGGMWTDDYPSVSVTVRFRDGTELGAMSSVQRPFMLPWKVTDGAKTKVTYDVRLPMAIARLMPENAANRDRMSLEGFLRQWRRSEAVRQIRTEWETFLNSEPFSPLAPLMEEFVLEDARLADTKYCSVGGQSCGYDVAAAVTARPKGSTAAVRISAYLLAPNGHLHQPSVALERMRFVRDRIYAVPWLMEVLNARDPRLYARLRHPYPTGNPRDWSRLSAPESFSRWNFDQFAKDMTFLRKTHLIDEMRDIQDQIVMLSDAAQDILWLILPDGRVILWRYAPRSDLLAWKQEDILIEACAESTVQYRRCAGAIITPDGMLTP